MQTRYLASHEKMIRQQTYLTAEQLRVVKELAAERQVEPGVVIRDAVRSYLMVQAKVATA